MQTAEQTFTETPNLLKLNQKQERNFWNKVNKDGPIQQHCPELGKCWEWVAAKYPNGYGSFRVGKKNHPAHRVSWAIEHGFPKDGLLVCHRCDNRICIRPDHLFVGTHADNTADMIEKGRRAKYDYSKPHNHSNGENHWSRKNPSKICKGERHGRAKLSEKNVISIIKIGKSQPLSKTAKDFGVSAACISLIVNRKIWKDVKI